MTTAQSKTELPRNHPHLIKLQYSETYRWKLTIPQSIIHDMGAEKGEYVYVQLLDTNQILITRMDEKELVDKK